MAHFQRADGGKVIQKSIDGSRSVYNGQSRLGSDASAKYMGDVNAAQQRQQQSAAGTQSPGCCAMLFCSANTKEVKRIESVNESAGKTVAQFQSALCCGASHELKFSAGEIVATKGTKTSTCCCFKSARSMSSDEVRDSQAVVVSEVMVRA
jgi:hypothetical protein